MNNTLSSKRKGFCIVIGTIINNMLATATFVVLGLILAELVGKLNVPYTRLSVVYTFAYVGMLIGSMIAGKVVVKAGGKVAGLIATASVIVMIFVSCTATSVPPIYGAAVFYGFGNILAFMSMHIMITQWFERGAATLIGVGSAVGTVGCAVVSPILASMFVNSGLAAGGTKVAIVFAIVMVISSIVLCGNPPEKYGCERISFGKEKKESKTKKGMQEENYNALMPKSRIVRTPVFIFIVAMAVLGGLAINVYSNNQYMIFEEFGYDRVQSAMFVSAGTIVASVGSIVGGALMDVLGRRKIFTLFIGACAVLYILGFGIGGFLGCSLLVANQFFGTFDKFRPSILMNSMFGPEKSPDLISWDGIFVCAGSMIGAPFAANIAAATGSYRIAGYISAGLFVVCLILVLYVTSKSALKKLKKIDEQYK